MKEIRNSYLTFGTCHSNQDSRHPFVNIRRRPINSASSNLHGLNLECLCLTLSLLIVFLTLPFKLFLFLFSSIKMLYLTALIFVFSLSSYVRSSVTLPLYCFMQSFPLFFSFPSHVRTLAHSERSTWFSMENLYH